jgi:hypothetical protein
MLSANDSNQTIALSLGQRRLQTVSVQKPPQNMQQITLDASSVQPGTSQQQGQMQETRIQPF